MQRMYVYLEHTIRLLSNLIIENDEYLKNRSRTPKRNLSKPTTHCIIIFRVKLKIRFDHMNRAYLCAYADLCN